MPLYHYIGIYVRVGTVVTCDVPNYSVAVGVSANVVKTFEH